MQIKASNLIPWLARPRNLWITIFLYTIISGLFVQLILLPYIATSWQSEYGHGLLKGVDGPKFNRIALTLAQEIEAEGWDHWNLTPNGQLVSGVAAIFYVLIYPEPWAVLPFNAVLNATASLCFYLLLSLLIDDRNIALISTLPFTFFPSALLWNTQFHNENYVVPGVVFIFLGWLLAVKNDVTWLGKYKFFVSLVLVLFGSLLIGLVRNFILDGLSYLFVFSSLVVALIWLFERLEIAKYLAKLAPIIFSCVIMLFITSVLNSGDPQIMSNSNGNETLNLSETQISRRANDWKKSLILPEFIDHNLRSLAGYRWFYTRPFRDGGSNIDMDVNFSDSRELIAYVPRAIQIGLFSPFPNIWYVEAEKPAGRAMRMVTSVEELFSYFCLIGLPIFVLKHKNDPFIWIAIFVCVSMLIVYAIVMPNQGTLYRFRYPYYMPLVSFGFAGWLEKNKKKFVSL